MVLVSFATVGYLCIFIFVGFEFQVYLKIKVFYKVIKVPQKELTLLININFH